MRPRAIGKSFCHCCRARRFRQNNPERYAYNNLKGNARRRNKEFTITFDYFLRFINRTLYMSKKGIYKESLHIDRKREQDGYIPGNLQVLTNSLNVKKYLHYDFDNKGKPSNFKYAKTQSHTQAEENHPF